MTREDLIAAATVVHHEQGCGCDPRYLMSCPRMAVAILDLARPVGAQSCCDLHNVHCEPPSEMCCRGCPEAGHPEHPRGVRCVLDRDEEKR